MKKRILLLLLMTALLMTGCAQRAVRDMYSPPKRSEEYSNLQSAIDMAMEGLEYSAPISGDHQQMIQMADLNADGNDEYLVFAKGNSEKPLQILVFQQTERDDFQLIEVIASNGSAFDQVEYIQMDDQPGLELVVSRRISDQLQRSVSVYSFAGENSRQLMIVSCFKFLSCDLNDDGLSELMVLQQGQTEMDNGVAALFSFQNGSMERSLEARLSRQVENIRRIMAGRIQGGHQAVYIASAVDENSIITDILTLKNGRFVNISFTGDSETSVQTLRNYYVYADDVDEDGVLELPRLVSIQQIAAKWSERQYIILWYSLDLEGNEVEKMYTFHNYGGGWYLQLPSDWGRRVAVYQEGYNLSFYVWDEAYEEAESVFSISALTGSDRESRAQEDGICILKRTEGAIYVATLAEAAAEYNITQQELINRFRIIHEEWKTGET